LISVLGLVYIRYTWVRIENEQSELVLKVAKSIEISLPKDDLKALEAKPGDIEKPQYQDLKQILISIIHVNKEARFAYIYFERQGKIYFCVDSEPYDSPDYSPPGQEYTEARSENDQQFKDDKGIITPPFSDRWGKWKSVLIPIKDETSGKIIAVFGMDFNIKVWIRSILFGMFELCVQFIFLLLAFYFLIVIATKQKLLKNEIIWRKKIEETLRKNEEKLNKAERIGKLGYWQIYLNSKMIWADEESMRIFGFPPFTGELPKEVVTPCIVDFQTVNQAIKDLVKANDIFDYEYLIHPADNSSEKFVHTIIEVERDSNGLPVNISGIVQDITDRKRAGKEINEALIKAESGSRLKTAFMDNISHELRTPLNNILGFSNLITRTDNTDSEKLQYNSYIKASSDQLLNVVTNYMDISLITSGNLEVNCKRIDLHMILNQIYSQFRPLCDVKNLTINLAIPENTGGVKLYTDVELFRKALSHLLDNAIKFTNQGQITFGYKLQNGSIEFYVKDTGIGIDEEFQLMIFDSFNKEELSSTVGREGSGLGLSIANGFVRLIGGELQLDSKQGVGSTFFFSLPYYERSSDKIINENFNSIPILKNPVILIAEDDEFNLTGVCTCLM